MQRRTLFYGAAAVVALAGAIGWSFAPRPLEVDIATATLGPFELTLDEDAKTRVRDRYVVSAPLAGRLARVTLREGDAVSGLRLVAYNLMIGIV